MAGVTDGVLPEGWLLLNFDSLVLNVNGARKPVSVKMREHIKGPYPYYGATGEIDSLNDFTHQGEHVLIGEDGANLISKSKNLAFIVDGRFWVNNHAHAVKCLADVPAKFVANYINSLDLSPWVSGSAQPKLTKANLSKIPTPVPPLAEQKVIAEKLDSLLTQVESTKARLERLPEILKRFRQSVLAAAVSGKLTEEWREQSSYSQNGYPSEWTELGFSQVGQLARGKSKHRPRNDPQLFGSEYPFIQTGEVANSNGYITEAKKYYSEFGLAQSRLFPKGTLCITIAANIADTSILGIDACFPDSVVGFTPDISKCDALFVKYLIDVNKAHLEDFAPATAQKNINLKILNEIRIPFPSLKEQTEIVRRVEELFAYADTIQEQADAALQRVNSLTQSILAKAFRGELTADWRAANPELISGENSAGALLEKIKAERAAQKPKKKTRAKKNA